MAQAPKKEAAAGKSAKSPKRANSSSRRSTSRAQHQSLTRTNTPARRRRGGRKAEEEEEEEEEEAMASAPGISAVHTSSSVPTSSSATIRIRTTSTTTITTSPSGDGYPLFLRAIIFLLLASGTGLLLSRMWVRYAPPAFHSESCAGASPSTLLSAILPSFVGGTGNIKLAVKEVFTCTRALRQESEIYVALSLASLYISLQTFAIPGTLLLSIVAGALYGVIWGGLFVASCATVGAFFCYSLSWAVMRPLIEACMPRRLAIFRKQVRRAEKDGSLVWFLLFARITPAAPNWFVNAASPVVGIPLLYFVFATAVGLVPANYFHTQMGTAIASVAEMSTTTTTMRTTHEGVLLDDGSNNSSSNSNSSETSNNWTPFITLGVLQLIALTPVIVRKCTANARVRTWLLSLQVKYGRGANGDSSGVGIRGWVSICVDRVLRALITRNTTSSEDDDEGGGVEDGEEEHDDID